MPLALARAAAKRLVGHAVQSARIRRYLADHGSRRLNLGCGHHLLEDWLNVDLEGALRGPVFMDLTKPLPLPEGAFEAALCEHLIEHLPRPAGGALMAEAFRVLAPGGRIRVVTPDLETLAGMCVNPPSSEQERYLEFVAGLHGLSSITPGDALNYIFYDYGHRHIYSVGELTAVLAAAGFSEIRSSRAGHPIDPSFVGVEGHPGFMGLENDAVEAFALEAKKPG
jgi:SAM-dependent methyltransferase